MKSAVLASLLGVASLYSWAGSSPIVWQSQVAVSGHVSAEVVPEVVYYVLNGEDSLHKAKIDADGGFSFKCYTGLPPGGGNALSSVRLYCFNDPGEVAPRLKTDIPPSVKYINFFLDTTAINIDIDLETGTMLVNGGYENDVKSAFDEINSRFRNELLNFKGDLDSVQQKKYREELILIAKHPGSVYAFQKISTFFRESALPVKDDVLRVISGLDPAVLGEEKIKNLLARYETFYFNNTPRPGIFPSLGDARLLMADIGLNYKQLRHSYDYLLIELWATWCGPCIRDHPKLRELAQQHSTNKKFSIVGLAIMCGEKSWNNYMKLHGSAYPNFWIDWSQYAHRFRGIDVGGVPRYFIVRTRDNRIMEQSILFERIKEKIDNYL